MLYGMPRKSNSEEKLQALGARVRRAREARRISADTAAEMSRMSPVTWLRVENGRGGVRGLTYAGVEQALGWRLGAIEDFLNHGTEPGPAERDDDNRVADVREAVADDIKALLDDPELDDEARHELAKILMDAWHRDVEEAHRRRVDNARTIAETYKRGRGAA